jgi:small GTP-binding protein
MISSEAADGYPIRIAQEYIQPRLNDNESQSEYALKFLFVGDAETGKTSLFRRIAEDKFDETYKTSVGIDFRTKRVGLCLPTGHLFHIRAQMWDVGLEKYRTVSESEYKTALGIFFTYDLTDRKTFDSLKNHWIPQAKRFITPNTFCVIVGLKLDIADENVTKRQIQIDEGRELARANGMSFIECSNKSGEHCADAFTTLVYYCMERNITKLQAMQEAAELAAEEAAKRQRNSKRNSCLIS